jgi:hypothetical protein
MNFYLNHIFYDAWIMYEFLFEPCILRYLNYIWIFIWTVYFKVLELCMKKNNFLIILWFYNSFYHSNLFIYLFILLSEFILYFSYRIKNIFLTILLESMEFKDEFSKIFDEMALNFGIIQGYHTRKHSD